MFQTFVSFFHFFLFHYFLFSAVSPKTIPCFSLSIRFSIWFITRRFHLSSIAKYCNFNVLFVRFSFYLSLTFFLVLMPFCTKEMSIVYGNICLNSFSSLCIFRMKIKLKFIVICFQNQPTFAAITRLYHQLYQKYYKFEMKTKWKLMAICWKTNPPLRQSHNWQLFQTGQKVPALRLESVS